MTEKQRFPQIPSTVWWGIRSILQKTPRATVDERMLGVQIGVQEAAARQYIVELKNVGILDENCRSTDLGSKWRLDQSYPEAVEELIKKNYPEGLIHLANPSEGDRQKVVAWFEREGPGRGAAGNKAATYLLLGSPTPNEAPAKANSKPAKKTVSAKKKASSDSLSSGARESSVGPSKVRQANGDRFDGNVMPLNVNVQIHISADAGVDQINAIFAAMRRYLSESSDA